MGCLAPDVFVVVGNRGEITCRMAEGSLIYGRLCVQSQGWFSRMGDERGGEDGELRIGFDGVSIL